MRGDSLPDEEIKKYLFHELSQAERERFEEKLFAEDDYFYEVLEAENDLVDRYALGILKGEELARFERSLPASPQRREKVASSRALQRRIAEERQATANEAASAAEGSRRSIRERLAGFFRPQGPTLRYAGAALMLLLGCGLVFLLVERARLGREVAGLREGRERELREQIDASRAREAELRRQIERESERAQELDEHLAGEGAERERLQQELEKLRRVSAPTAPTVATVFLPLMGRGGGGVKAVSVGRETRRVVLGLELEESASVEGRYSVEVNGRVVAPGLRPKSPAGGRPRLTVSVRAEGLAEGINRVAVMDESGRAVGDYELRVRRR